VVDGFNFKHFCITIKLKITHVKCQTSGGSLVIHNDLARCAICYCGRDKRCRG